MSEKCIAVATDFSSRADRAVDRGLQLGRDSKRAVRFIHAVEAGGAGDASKEELDRRMELCVGYTAGTDQGGGPIEYCYPEGSAPLAIASAGSVDDVDMLLIGPARYNSLGDFFMGTAVDYVLRYTATPTLIVKQRVRGPYTHIVAGTDFSDGSAHAIIEAARLFPDAHIHVMHAWHVPFEGFQRDGYVAEEVEGEEAKKLDEFMKMLQEREPALASATSGLVRGGAFDAVKEGLKEYPQALVALGSHGATGFREATLGSNTSDILRFLDGDMLVVNVKGAA